MDQVANKLESKFISAFLIPFSLSFFQQHFPDRLGTSGLSPSSLWTYAFIFNWVSFQQSDSKEGFKY